MTPTPAHVTWLIIGLLLFGMSIFLSLRSLLKGQGQIKRIKEGHSEELRRMEATRNSESWKAAEIRKQLENEKKEALQELDEIRTQMARFIPLQIDIIQLARDLRQMSADAGPPPALKNCGPMPTGSDVSAWMKERMDESGLWTNAYSEWARKIIYRYQEEFAHRVKLVMTSLGKTTGMVVISLEPYTTDVRPGEDFQTLIDLLLGFFVKLEISVEERKASSYIARQDRETIKFYEDMPSEQMQVVLENPKMKSFVGQAYERKNKENGKVESP